MTRELPQSLKDKLLTELESGNIAICRWGGHGLVPCVRVLDVRYMIHRPFLYELKSPESTLASDDTVVYSGESCDEIYHAAIVALTESPDLTAWVAECVRTP